MFDEVEAAMSVEKKCLDCDTMVTFPERGDATCPGCGGRMYLNDAGGIGRYPREDWAPGGIQGYADRPHETQDDQR